MSRETLASGVQLGNWVLSRKIGDGACGQVFLAREAKDTSGKGPEYALKVTSVVDTKSVVANGKKRKKTDEERAADTLYAEHQLYQQLRHGGIPIIPPGAYGETKGFRYLAMQLLGDDLDTVVKQKGSLAPEVTARIGLQLVRHRVGFFYGTIGAYFSPSKLDILEYLHSKKLIFVDIKPANFMLGKRGTPDENKVFCVDFGLAERYVTYRGEHKPFKTQTIVGTPTFLSVAAHSGSTPSRRDDIEALGYVLVYMMKGSLPWADANSNTEGYNTKKNISVDSLCENLPATIVKFIEKARAYKFDDTPEYDTLKSLLRELAGGKSDFSIQDLDKSGGGAGKSTATAKKRSSGTAVSTPQRRTSRKNKEEEAAVASRKEESEPTSKAGSKALAGKVKKTKKAPARGRKKTAEPSDISSEEEEEHEEVKAPSAARRSSKTKAAATPKTLQGKGKRATRKDDDEEVKPKADTLSTRRRGSSKATDYAEQARQSAARASQYASAAAATALSSPETVTLSSRVARRRTSGGSKDSEVLSSRSSTSTRRTGPKSMKRTLLQSTFVDLSEDEGKKRRQKKPASPLSVSSDDDDL